MRPAPVPFQSRIKNSETLLIFGDFSGYFGSTPAGYQGTRGGLGYGDHTVKERLVEFFMTNELVICTSFLKQKVHHLINYQSERSSNQFDYIYQGLPGEVKIEYWTKTESCGS